MNRLKLYLTINSLFSAFSGIAMLLFSDGLNALFDITNAYVFPIIGLNLLIFSVFVWFVSVRYLSNKLLVNIISGMDAMWVKGILVVTSLSSD
jgi:hypothetical protein